MKEIKERFGPKRPNEVSVYTVTIGELDPFAAGEKMRAQEAAIGFIIGLEGFVGVHPVIGKGTLLLFYTEEQAKAAREALIRNGCPVGNNVCEVFVPTEDMPVWH